MDSPNIETDFANDQKRVTQLNDPLFIAVPAWGAAYVNLAVRYTIPAALKALQEIGREATWVIHTDNAEAFDSVLRGQRRKTRCMPQIPDARDHWQAFHEAHRQAIELTPIGGLVMLLNADIVVSRETFRVVCDALQPPYRVGVSIGIRSTIDGNTPPVGADAETLARWIWTHRHPITSETVWGRGRSRLPTVLFFPEGESVSFHSFHLTPMWVVKDKPVRFSGTIDEDLLDNYADHEVRYFTDREFVVAELSPASKRHPVGALPMTVPSVLDWARVRIKRKAHVRNFQQRFTLLGNPTRDHPAARQIMAGI